MSRTARTYCLIFGGIELLGALLWCLAGAGIYGSPPITGAVLLFLLSGPLLVLPAALCACRSRRAGGVLMFSGGLVSAAMAMPWLMTDAGLLPWLLVSLPMTAVGAALLQTRTERSPAPVASAPIGLSLLLFFVGLLLTYALLIALAINLPVALGDALGRVLAGLLLVLGVAVRAASRAGEVLHRELFAGAWTALALGLLMLAVR